MLLIRIVTIYNFPKSRYQRWSPRGHILKSLALASKVKSLASKPQVLENALSSAENSTSQICEKWAKVMTFFLRLKFHEIIAIFARRPFFWRTLVRCVLGHWPRALLALASRGSVLGKSVLGLGFFCALGLGFFCALGLEPCVRDSTSGCYFEYF